MNPVFRITSWTIPMVIFLFYLSLFFALQCNYFSFLIIHDSNYFFFLLSLYLWYRHTKTTKLHASLMPLFHQNRIFTNNTYSLTWFLCQIVLFSFYSCIYNTCDNWYPEWNHHVSLLLNIYHAPYLPRAISTHG